MQSVVSLPLSFPALSMLEPPFLALSMLEPPFLALSMLEPPFPAVLLRGLEMSPPWLSSPSVKPPRHVVPQIGILSGVNTEFELAHDAL